MKLEETRKALSFIRSSFPFAYKGMEEEDISGILEAWHSRFKNDDSRLVAAAVAWFVDNDKTGMPPSIGQIKSIMKQLSEGEEDDSPEQLFRKWRQTLRNLPSNSVTECRPYYDALPEVVKQIYDISDMIYWAWEGKTANLVQYEQPRFMKAVKEIQESRKAEMLEFAERVGITGGKKLLE